MHSKNKNMSDHIIVTNANELIRIPVESLAYIASDGNYSDIFTIDGKKYTVTLQLGVIEDMINQQLKKDDDNARIVKKMINQQPLETDIFARIGKSLIVNMKLIHYINPSKKQLILSDCHTFNFCLEASKEALKNLKEHFEKKLKK